MPKSRRNRLLTRLKVDLQTLAAVAGRGDWEAAARVQRTIAVTVSALRDLDAPASPDGWAAQSGRTVH